MASGQSPITHCIPALEPIVEDIFLSRNKSNTQDFKELETTREVLLSMLLRLLEYPEIIELLVLILNESKFCTDNTEKWLKWSQQVADIFLPNLNDNKIRLDTIESLTTIRKLIFVLNPSVFKPINDVLIMSFQNPPTNVSPSNHAPTFYVVHFFAGRFNCSNKKMVSENNCFVYNCFANKGGHFDFENNGDPITVCVAECF